MQFIPSNASDISKYYLNTYVKFPDTQDTLCFIKKVGSNKVTGFTNRLDETGMNQEFVMYLHEDAPYEVDYILPHKSFFQFERNACLLYRVPARQYQRGLSEKNTRITVLKPDGGWGMATVDFPALTAYVEKQAYPSLTAAVANKDKLLSIALSSRFAYVPKIKAIYLDSKNIAKVDDKAGTIVCKYPVFAAELAALDKSFKVM